MQRVVILLCITGSLLTGCSVGKSSVSATKKYSPERLRKDYTLYRNILETHHPSLYWYTSKDSMDYYFRNGEEAITDSMTEPGFRKLLAYVTSKINCGHTTIKPSKAWSRFSDTIRLAKMFPFSIKTWQDTVAVTANLNRKDSILKRGTVIKKINGLDATTLIDTLFNYLSTDGHNNTHKYQVLSNRGYFGSLYTHIFGLQSRYSIEYLDSTGALKEATIPVYDPASDTAVRRTTNSIIRTTTPQPSKKERKELQMNAVRLLKIDTATGAAMMNLSSFGKGYGLKRFFKNSFKELRKRNINHLIIDVRSNGGGNVTNSTHLTKYIANCKFKICDSLFAVKKKSPYQRYIHNHFWNKLFITFFTRKRSDGNYHFGYFEKQNFKPVKRNHYNGKTYILTGGNSFSATTLFAGTLKGQENVTIVGEETGGGAYGNSAWLIPDVTLPETGIRFRLPLFRLVIDKNHPKTGKGVQPDVIAIPTTTSIRNNKDVKIDAALQLIQEDKEGKKE